MAEPRAGAALAEERCRRILDSLPGLVWACRADGTCDFASAAWVAYTGLPASEHHGLGWQRVLHPDDQARAARAWTSALASAGRFEIEARLRRHDGEYRWFSLSSAPSRDDEGAVVAWSGIAVDVHERHEHACHDAADLARAFDVLDRGEPCFVLDRDFRYVFVNPGQERLSRRSRSETLGRTLWEVFPTVAGPHSRYFREYHRAMLERVPVEFDEYYAPLDLWTHVNVYPTKEGGIAVFFRDITARKRDEEERGRLLAALREAAARANHSRAQLEAVFGAIPDGIVVFDMEGNVLLVNGAEAVRYDFTSAEQMRIEHFATSFELTDLDGRVLPVDAWPVSRVLRGESFAGWQLHARRLDTGREWFFSFSGVPVRDEEGKQILAIVVTRDITEYRRAEAALRESEEQYRAFFETAIVGMGQADPATGRILRVNDRYCEITGYSREELLSGTVRDMTHPDDRHEDWEKYTRMVRGEVAEYCTEKRYIRKDGRLIWVHVAARLIRDATGKPIRSVGIMQDITQRKEAEQALRESEAALRAADRHKDEFLAMLSHELRNPLAPIRNGLYILERAAPGGPQARRAHAAIERQVTHMTRLIDDLLDVTRISRGKIQLQREQVELGELVHRLAEDHASTFEQAGVELAVEVEHTSLCVDGDPTRLAQVVGNLLTNAVKFTPRGGQALLSVKREGNEVVVCVRDDGAGIPPETLPHVFEPFVQADRTLDRSRGGLGLGLSLVKGLCEMHGGTVTAESAGLGRGAVFTVRLPLVPAIARSRAAAPGVAPREPPRRVLVIEDNVDAAETLREALGMSDHVVEVAFAGPEGIEKARRFEPDVVLCDIGLPGMDGYGVARTMRADPKLRSVYLVALSGYALQEDVERSRQAGFDRHIAKPPSLTALEKMLAEVGRTRLEEAAGPR
ncbi:PAS domain S-box protein [Polyangium sp. y55x31]|uniref:PAS domain-containing hybrid sensor histidine kinase/response regulator n=1 Tax=Polyangium sp. y55x31 TaxID=3042688 RepID=UPI002482A807|nr:PAS domain S-box protein [Polyangium sp. y55x31]MDI1475461.1 PAS domain S-box protein [Polyangium sp. y55x31]